MGLAGGGASLFALEKTIKANMSLLKGIYGDAKIKSAFKLAPGRSLNAAKSMTQHMSKLKTISNAASKGSVVLIGVGLATGAIISILLVGTPVGWGVLLVVGVGSAYASYKVGEVAGSVYKSNFSDVDIVNSLGITRVCN